MKLVNILHKSIVFVIFLNKIDVYESKEERKVKIDIIRSKLASFQKKYHFDIFEVSALTGEGIDKSFNRIIDILESKEILKNFRTSRTQSFSLAQPRYTKEFKKKKERRCC